METAGKALRQVLTAYGISQNKLAVTMGISRSIVFKWFHGHRDPTAETVREIAKALQSLDRAAADEFVRLYLGEFLENSDDRT
ncbi:helix-turn-helix transcriptional regulator [Oscillatoriales cyanobacterium LEGE 11467]|uniref:Helix-turn-helix transcriptional regulator n=1 Tax=Zarconia navalis LEGE 11467 TaxID=1828826 RepID=A0A928Z5Y8_9CYAN|nr:helix-turn-helix transcriptional regulator [Zarconia navalis]MBE9039802.1 helix-turn-helix transcriptional regulator [Zarconia navalis LEGE 11467]